MKGLCGIFVVFSMWGAVGCGSTGTTEETVGRVTEALAPAGSNAHFVGVGNLSSTLFPGERRLVQVTMQNTGASSPANDWTTTNPTYDLLAPSTAFGWSTAPLPATVPVGSSATFGVVITAPAASDTFTAQMNAEALGTFGDTAFVPVTISAAATPQWGCTFVPSASTLPPVLAPGESRTITLTVQNTGSQTWPSTGLRLASDDTPSNLWGTTASDLSVNVPPGASVSFSVLITAPATPGTYSFQRDMNIQSSIGDFRLTGHCVSSLIAVSASVTPSDGAAVVSQSIPTRMVAGKPYVFAITMQNTGSSTWTGSDVALASTNTPVDVWGTTSSALGAAESVPSGASRAFTLVVTAPATPGTYSSSWRMQRASVPFGATALTSNMQVTLCGNGVVDAGEQCDDGNLINGDGCSTSCTAESLCGNGVLNAGEQCDDGNTVAGDGCSPTCTIECKRGHGPRPRHCR